MWFFSGIPGTAWANFAARLAWNASDDPNVASYKLYYGTVGDQFTNVVSEGTNTSAVISGLVAGTTYFFAAASLDRAGDESPFSDEVAFLGANAIPGAALNLPVLQTNYTTDPLVFSLDTNAPAGAAIDPASGVFSWTPGNAYACTTNFINVHAADVANPSLNITETLVVVVGDYLKFQLGATSALANQTASLPLIVAASGTVTNLQFSLNWQANQLLKPTLSVVAPFVAGSLSMESGLLVVRLQTLANEPFTGSQEVAQISFQAASSQPSSTICQQAFATGSGNAADGSSYVNVWAQSGEVVLVGGHPLLRPSASAGVGRNLCLYAKPGSYQLLYTPSLNEPVTWKPVLTCKQTSAEQTIPLDPNIPCAYYQVKLLDPAEEQSPSLLTR
ncbi:MAG: fibronectin type III domain-containing protein [Verrucomicrobiota bacterium]